MPPPFPRPGSQCGGYTLVELVMAATLLGLAISGVMSMIGSGRQMEVENGLRRQARIVASGMLEDTLYHFSRYHLFAAGQTNGAEILMAGSDTPIPATTRLTIGDSLSTLWNDIPGSGSRSLSYRRVEARVTWTVDGRTESVSIWKTIARAGYF